MHFIHRISAYSRSKVFHIIGGSYNHEGHVKKTDERLDVTMSQDVKKTLNELSKTTGAGTLGELLRRALAVYSMLSEHQGSGGIIVLRDLDGTECTLNLGMGPSVTPKSP